jgi:phosphoribosyl 1,2-cyclic phosphate phosphodiesterase
MPAADPMPSTLTFLGTGTSTGVPVLGCTCETCTSDDPRDRRLRPSLLIEHAGQNIAIDLTPDFRYQMLRSGAARLDAVLITHDHADHTHGIDDVRPLNWVIRGDIPMYAIEPVGRMLQSKFPYCFNPWPSPGCPSLAWQEIHWFERFEVCGLPVLPLQARHNHGDVTVYRFDSWAYCSDVKSFPDKSLAALRDLDLLILDALRPRPHAAHLSIDEALEVVERLRPKRTLFTHMTHDVLHDRESKLLPDGVTFAVDGLQVEVD